MVIKESIGTIFAETVFTLGIAGMVDVIKADNLRKRVRRCEVHYGVDSKVTITKLVAVQ